MKKAKKDNQLKIISISVISITILIMSLITISYAYFTFSQDGRYKNSISTGNISFTYNEESNAISLTNTQPISDEVAKTLTYFNDQKTYFDFMVSNNSSATNDLSYEVYLTIDNNLDNILDSKYVKVYLTSNEEKEIPISGFDKEVPVISNLQTISTVENAKSLYVGTLSAQEKKNFRLRIWLSEDFVPTDVSYNYKIKVNVRTIN